MKIIRIFNKNPLVFLIRCPECERVIQMEEETTFCPLCMREIEQMNIIVWDEWVALPVLDKITMLAEYEKKYPDNEDVFDDKRVGVKLDGNY